MSLPTGTDLPSLIQKAVLLGLLGAAVGCGAGAVMGAISHQRRRAAEDRAALAMPPLIAGIPPLADPLVQLAAQVKSYDDAAFRALCKKLHNMLRVTQWVHEAPPEAIQQAHKHLGTEYAAGVTKYLEDFYTASGVVLVKAPTGPEKWSTAMVPLRRDLRETHELLTCTVELLAQEVDTTAAQKIKDVLAERT